MHVYVPLVLCCFIVLAYEKEGLEMEALSACCILLVISYIATELLRLARHVFLFVPVHRVISYQIRSACMTNHYLGLLLP